MDNRPHLVKDFDKLSPDLQEKIKLFYPFGFEDHLITFYDSKGATITALPYENEQFSYLVRMTKTQAQILIEEDTDYDATGKLKERIKEEYEGKYEEGEFEVAGED